MSYLFWLSVLLFIFCLGLVFWMKWRMKASKGRFAVATVSAMVTCLMLGLSAGAVGLPSIVASKISEALGYGVIESEAPEIFVFALTVVALVLIYRFASIAIRNWEAPVRVSETALAEHYLDDNLYALTVAQLRLLLKRQVDPVASDLASNWKTKLPELPKPAEVKDLLRDLLATCVREIQIPSDGWRDNGQLWVGNEFGLLGKNTNPLVALVFDDPPTKDELSARLDRLVAEQGLTRNTKIYAVYMSRQGTVDSSGIWNASGLDVEILSSRQMIVNSLDLKGYARELLNTFRNTKVGGTNATLANSFVDLFVQRPESAQPPINLETKLNDWMTDDSSAHLVVTGQYGQGKSTAFLKYCCDWAERFLNEGEIQEPVPLLVELRGKSPSETDPLGLLSTWCSRYRLLPQQVLNLIKSGEAIVIFEGFDELRNSGREFDRHQHFNALWRFAYPGTKIVFTGRPNIFLNQVEANKTLRTDVMRGADGGAYTEAWELQKLDKAQIAKACRNYEPMVRKGIIKSAKNNDEFFDIVARPSMLPVVATIWGDIEQLQKAGTRLTGAVLIEKYIQAVFSRKEAELEQDRIRFDAPSGSRYLTLPKPIRELLTICVAWRMIGLGGRNTISRSEVTEMVKDVYETLLTIAKSENVAPDVSQGLIEFENRHAESTMADKVETITAEICSAGLLISDPAGGTSNLGFPHKQFFEFLVAKAICISKSPYTTRAAAMISASSPEKGIMKRIRSETNAINYLVECAGTPLSILFSRLEMILMYISIKISKLLFLFSPKTMTKSAKIFLDSALYEDEFELDEYNYSYNAYIKYRLLMNIAFIFSFNVIILTILWALINNPIVNDEPFIANLLSKEIGVLQKLGVLAMIFWIVGMAMLVAVLPRIEVLLKYLDAHWYKAGQIPESEMHVFDLAATSLRKQRVEFPYQEVRFKTDFSQFLYPSKELDR